MQNQVLFEVGAPILGGYFVNTGLVSCLTVMKNGDSVEVGLLGHEGFAGLPILLNIAHSSARITVQISGDALRSTQARPSALTATLSWVRGVARCGQLRPVLHTGQAQFHCGNPPPAAAPST